MNEAIGHLLPELRRELERALPGTSGWNIKPVMVRRHGAIYKATSPHLSDSVAIKVFADGKLRDTEPTRIFQALSSYQPLEEGTPLLTVPRPLAVAPGLGAVMMQWIDAPTLKASLASRPFSRRHRDGHIHHAARWLCWFHAQSGVTRESYDPAPERKAFKRRLHEIQTLRPDFLPRNPAVERHMANWQQAAAQLKKLKLAHAVTHGDFTPSNLFVGKDSITGFDMAGGDRWPVTADICRFMIYLNFSRLRQVPAAALKNQGCDGRDFENFMKAYGSGATSIPMPAMRCLLYGEILRRWLSLVRQNLENPRLRRTIQIFHLKRMAHHLSAGLLDA